jgi:mannose-6-phosphate isomerase-like protein (cupin superfamily)
MKATEEILLQTSDVRVRIMPLAVGSATVWHTHSVISDHMVCLSGRIRVALRQPEEIHDLAPGEWCRVPVGRPHRVVSLGDAPSSYLLIQGVGAYDFNPIEHID